MSCTACQATKIIPSCTDELVIGSVEDASTDLYVYIKNLTTGYVHRQEVMSNEYGLVTLDLSLPDISFYNPNNTYESWVTLQDAQIDDRLPVTIGDDDYTCFALNFEKVFDETGIAATYETHTLEADI